MLLTEPQLRQTAAELVASIIVSGRNGVETDHLGGYVVYRLMITTFLTQSMSSRILVHAETTVHELFYIKL